MGVEVERKFLVTGSGWCEVPLVEKNRYAVQYRGLVWEVDEFLGDNKGLIVAEVELESEDQAIEIPDWVGTEVTEDPRFFNSSLASTPYKLWANSL